MIFFCLNRTFHNNRFKNERRFFLTAGWQTKDGAEPLTRGFKKIKKTLIQTHI